MDLVTLRTWDTVHPLTVATSNLPVWVLHTMAGTSTAGGRAEEVSRRACRTGMDPLWFLEVHPLQQPCRTYLYTYHVLSKPSWPIKDHNWGLFLPKAPNPTLDPTETSKRFSSSISLADGEATPRLPALNATSTLRAQRSIFEMTLFFF